MNIIVKNVEPLFVNTWLEINKPKASEILKKRSYGLIPRLENELKECYHSFMNDHSEVNIENLSSFFKRQVIVARKRTKIVRLNVENVTNPVFVLFDVNHKKYVYGFDPWKVTSTHPIRMTLPDLFKMYGMEFINDKEWWDVIGDKYKVDIDVLGMDKDNIHAAYDNGLFGCGTEYDRKIMIGMNKESEYFWLPSDNLIKRNLFCRKDNCLYSTHQMSNLLAHEESCTDEQIVTSEQVSHSFIQPFIHIHSDIIRP